MPEQIIQTEFDSHYFDVFGEVMLKSCRVNNPDWKIHVLDFGLRPEQRELVSRVATVDTAAREIGNRWSTIRDRIKTISRLLNEGNTVMHVDGDVFIPGCIGDVIKEMDANAVDAAYMPTWMKIRNHVRHMGKFTEITGLENNEQLDESTLAGVIFALRPSDAVKQVYSYLVDKWEELRGVLYTEESAMWCAHTLHKLPYTFIDWTYGWPVDDFRPTSHRYVVPSDTPFTAKTGERLRMVHFANSVWLYTNLAGSGHSDWHAWHHATKPYRDIPWEQVAQSAA